MVEKRNVVINLEEFDEVGRMKGFDGRNYAILVAKDLGSDRKTQILSQIIFGTLELRGHYYDPKSRTD
jgi:hypothetical protein